MSLVNLQAGQIAFNGYIFNRAFILAGKDAEVSTDSVDLPFVPGIYVPQGKPGPKTFTVTGTIGGIGANVDQNGNQYITADNVQAELDRLSPLMYQGRAPLQWCFGSTNRWVYAQAGKPRITYSQGNGYRTATLQLDFTADDPREYSYKQHATNLSATGTTSTGGSASATVNNAGTFRAYPVLTLTFSAQTQNPQITFTPPSGGSIGFTLNGTFQTTDTVVITCDPRARNLTKNGTQTWSLLSLPVTNTVSGSSEFLPYLDPGNTTVAISDANGTAQLAVAWFDTWI